MKIKLSDWAALHYSPPPSAWVLRQWRRTGRIFPPPEKVGKGYYVDEVATRMTDEANEAPRRLTLVEKLEAMGR